MIRFKALYAAILLSGLSLLGSCQKEVNNPIQEEEVYTQFVELGGEIEELNTDAVIDLKSGKVEGDEQLRMAFANKQSNGQNNGVSFVYGNNEAVKLYLFFQQGSNTALVTVDGTISTNDKGKKVIKKALTGIPNTIDLNQGNVTVTGVIGVKNARIEGGKFLADVPSIKELQAANNGNYMIPMYFPATKISPLKNPGNQATHSFYAKFQVYGAIVGIPMKNNTDVQFTLYSTELLTPFFQTQGTMDLSNITETTAPSWKSSQADNAVKVVDVVPDTQKSYQGFKSGSNGWYFFWVKPKTATISTSSKVTLSLKSFAGTEYKVEVPVKKVLAEQRVHRIPVGDLPRLPDLIFSEVFRFDEAWQTVFELYNCSDHPVNLWNYQMKSTKADGTSEVSPLLQYNGGVGLSSDDRCVFNRTLARVTPEELKREGAQYVNTSGKAIWPAFSADDYTNYMETKVILQPGEMALFVSQKVKFSPSIVKLDRDRLPFTVNFGDLQYKGCYIHHGGYVELQRGTRAYKATTISNAVTVDAIFKFKTQQPSYKIWAYTLMRKPDRNTPRKYMQIGEDGDWVIRRSTEDIDWGYRFGYEQKGSTLETIDWFDGRENWWNGYEQDSQGVQGNRRPLYKLISFPSSHSYFNRPFPDGTNSLYLDFPNNWKRNGGIAH